MDDEAGGKTHADGDATIEGSNERPAGNGGKEFISSRLDLLKQTRINCLYALVSETNDTQSKDESPAQKKDAQLKENQPRDDGEEFRSFCMNFLAHAIANDNIINFAHR